MKIRFIVEIDAGEYTFIIDTDSLPTSVGCRQVALKNFEIIEPDAPLTIQSTRPHKRQVI